MAVFLMVINGPACVPPPFGFLWGTSCLGDTFHVYCSEFSLSTVLVFHNPHAHSTDLSFELDFHGVLIIIFLLIWLSEFVLLRDVRCGVLELRDFQVLLGFSF